MGVPSGGVAGDPPAGAVRGCGSAVEDPDPRCVVAASTATTTRRIPAAMIASVHGGVRPWWAHGSRVTYMVPDRADVPAAASAVTSAWGPPGGAVAPTNPAPAAVPAPSTVPSGTTTAPTQGLGEECPRTDSAAPTARAIQTASSGPLTAGSALRTARPPQPTRPLGGSPRRPPGDGVGRTPPIRPRTRWRQTGPLRPRSVRQCRRRPPRRRRGLRPGPPGAP